MIQLMVQKGVQPGDTITMCMIAREMDYMSQF